MKKEELRSVKAYKDDVKEINLICLDEEINQADVIRKLLHKYINKN